MATKTLRNYFVIYTLRQMVETVRRDMSAKEKYVRLRALRKRLKAIHGTL